MQRDKITSILGFAVRAGNVIFGLDNIEISRKRHIVIYDNTASEGTVKSIKYMCKENSIPLIKSVQNLEDVVYKTNCKVIAIKDKQMSKAILANIDSNSFYMAEVI